MNRIRKILLNTIGILTILLGLITLIPTEVEWKPVLSLFFIFIGALIIYFNYRIDHKKTKEVKKLNTQSYVSEIEIKIDIDDLINSENSYVEEIINDNITIISGRRLADSIIIKDASFQGECFYSPSKEWAVGFESFSTSSPRFAVCNLKEKTYKIGKLNFNYKLLWNASVNDNGTFSFIVDKGRNIYEAYIANNNANIEWFKKLDYIPFKYSLSDNGNYLGVITNKFIELINFTSGESVTVKFYTDFMYSELSKIKALEINEKENGIIAYLKDNQISLSFNGDIVNDIDYLLTESKSANLTTIKNIVKYLKSKEIINDVIITNLLTCLSTFESDRKHGNELESIYKIKAELLEFIGEKSKALLCYEKILAINPNAKVKTKIKNLSK